MKPRIKRYIEEFHEKKWVTKKHMATVIYEHADKSPEEFIDYIPLIQTLIDEYVSSDKKHTMTEILETIDKIAKEYPEEVIPLTPDLKKCFHQSIEEEYYKNAIIATHTLGMIAKEYPHIAKDLNPDLKEATKIDNNRLAVNSMALLSDLAQTYPDELTGFLPRCREELESNDDYMRYNALTVATRVAEKHPDKVEKEIGATKIKEMLQEDLEGTRENACWALKHLGAKATTALPELHRLSNDDPNERVKEVAEYAAYHIENRDKNWKIN